MTANREFLVLHESSARQEGRAAVLLLLLLTLIRFKGIMHLSSEFLGGAQGDAGLYIWLFRSAVESLFTRGWFETYAFFPYAKTLAWSDSFLLPSMLAWPFLQAGVGLVFLYNLFILLAAFLNGYLTYRLAFRLCGSFWPALISGAGFMSLAWFSSNLGHPQLQFAFWLPLGLLLFMNFLAQPVFPFSFALGITILFSFLTTVYYSVFLALSVFAYILSLAIIRPQRFALREYANLILGLVPGLVLTLPFLVPYLQVKKTFGERGLYEAYSFAATFASYFSSSIDSMLYSWTSSFAHSEAHLFPGVITLLLAAFAFGLLGGTKKLRRHFLLFYAALGLACFFSLPFLPAPFFQYMCAIALWLSLVSFAFLIYKIGVLERSLGFEIMTNRAVLAQIFFAALFFLALSFGPLAAPDGNPQRGQFALGVFSLFYEIFPGVDSLRAIGRAGIVTIFFMLLSASFALSHLQQKKGLSKGVLAACFGLFLIENVPLGYPRGSQTPPPAVLQKVQSLMLPYDTIIFLPFTSRLKEDRRVASWGDYANRNSDYMNWTYGLPLNLVNGYSGQRSKLMQELPGKLKDFPDERSMTWLSRLAGLRFIVFLSGAVPEFDRKSFFARIEQWNSHIKLIDADEAGNFLFEFAAQTILDEKFHLLVPSAPAGKVRLELLAPHSPRKPEATLDVFLQEENRDVPVAAANVRAAGIWEEYYFPLPTNHEGVRPLRLFFRAQAEGPMFLRKRKFEVQSE